MCCLLGVGNILNAQLTSTAHTIIGSVKAPTYNKLQRRSGQNPTSCITDTVNFTRQGSSAFNTITIANGRSLGQFFSAPQSLTIHGFDFFAYAVTPNPPRDLKVNVMCNIYKAGLDSLPTGAPIASDTIELDTVSGSNILLSRIIRRAHFDSALTLDYNYVVVLECDSTNVNAAMVTNSWANGDGDRRNIGCGSINNVWYRCLNLNVGGTTFDCHMQFYPYVKYNFGTDFIVKNPCHKPTDTVLFDNLSEKNVSGSEFYNYYTYLNYERLCHLWRYSGSYAQYTIDGKYRYPNPSNENVKLESRMYQWSTGQWCRDTQTREIAFKPDNPSLRTSLDACKGDTVNLILNKTEKFSTPYWYKDLNSSPYDSGYSHVINNIQQNDTFYIRSINKTCKSPFVKRVLNVHDYPSPTTVKDDSICIGAVANLGANSSPGVLRWFENASGGVYFYEGEDYQTKALNADTSFYVEAVNNGCALKSGRVKVSAFVSNSFAPDVPLTSNDTIVCSPYGNIDLMASGSHTLRWYNQGVGGSPNKTGNTYSVDPQFKGKYKYYVENWNGVCGSGRKEINLTVNKALKLPTLDPVIVCEGDSASFMHTLSYGNVIWYDSLNQINPGLESESLVLYDLKQNRKVYYKHRDGECLSITAESSNIVVNKAPVPSIASAPSVCFKGQGLFNVQVPSGTVKWFKELNDEDSFSIGSQVIIPQVLSNLTYYYQTEDKGCKSDKKALTLTSKPRPVAGFSYSLLWQNRFRGTPVNAANTTFFWDFGDGNTSTSTAPLHQFDGPGNYTITQIATSNTNGCTDTVEIPVNISHVSTIDLSKTTVVFPNPVRNGQELRILDSKEITDWRLYNLEGRLLNQFKAESLRIENLSAGIYILHCQNLSKSSIIKIEVIE